MIRLQNLFKRWHRTFLLLMGIATCSLLFSSSADSEPFRSFSPIATPGNADGGRVFSMDGYSAVGQVQPVAGEVIRDVVADLFGSWHKPVLAEKLDRDFPNKRRILDAIQTQVPPHVELDVISIQTTRVLDQYERPHPDGDGAIQRMSRVAVTVRSQAAYSNPATRELQRVDGASEYVIRIVQKIR